MDGLVVRDKIVEQYTQRESLVIIPEGVTAIGEGAFKGCSSVEEVVLPPSVLEIRREAFKGCRKLKKINLPKGLNFVGAYAFHRCHSLISIVLPPSVKRLGDCVFLYCDQLEYVSIKSVEEMGLSVFLNCTNLRKIEISSTLIESCINEQFGGCTNISEVILDGHSYPIDIFTENTDYPVLVKKIAKDMFGIMEYDNGILKRYRVNLKIASIPEGIEEIGKSAFYDRKGIVVIKLPRALRKISTTAFRNCISLETIEFQSEDVLIEDDAFLGCTSLKQIRTSDGQLYSIDGLPSYIYTEQSVPKLVDDIHNKALKNFYICGTTLVKYRGNEDKVNIPFGIRVIGERAFANNENIDCVVLPETVEEIREEAFCNCTSMQKINLPASIRYIGSATFESCVKLLKVELPNIRIIEQSLFNRCYKLAEVKLPEELKEIADLAFYQCIALKKLDLPSSLKSIGRMAFYKNQSIKEIVLPSNISYLGSNAFTLSGIEKATIHCDLKDSGSDIFSQCLKLKMLIFSEGVSHIPDKIAFNCTKLKVIDLPVSLVSIGRNAFDGTAFLCKNEQVCIERIFIDGRSMIGDVTVSRRVKAIAGAAFYGNDKITSITLHEDIEYIGARAFCGCTGLKEINIPSKIVEINEGTFAYCNSLEKFSIDGELKIIGNNAFLSCNKLKYLPKLKVEYIGNNAFSDCTNLEIREIKVSRIAKDAFKATPLLSEQRKQGVVCISGIVVDGSRAKGDIVIPPDTKGIAPFAFAGNTDVSTVRLPDAIEYIGESAFMGCTNLNEVYFTSIPEFGDRAFSKSGLKHISGQVKTLGTQTFAYCKHLETVNLQGVSLLPKEVFTCCESLKYCSIPSLSDIGDYCFTACKALVEFDFSTVLTIGKHAFEQCFSLRSIGLKSNTSISEYAFCDCCYVEQIIITDSYLQLGSYAFSGCTSLREIILSKQKYLVTSYPKLFDKLLPATVKAIWLSAISCFDIDFKQAITAYRGNASFVKVPLGINRIGEDVFRDCFNLRDIEVPLSVTDIGGRAFLGTAWLLRQQQQADIVVLNNILIDSNKAIDEISIPENVQAIGEWAFAGCFSLKKLKINTSKVTVKEYAFRNCFMLKEIEDTKNKTIYTFTSLLDLLGNYPPLIRQIFIDCQNCFKIDESYKLVESTGNIVDLVLPEGITEIGDQVYTQSNLLTTCTFSSTIKKVGNYAFEKCKWLEIVKKMTQVESIGDFAFSGCQSLKYLELSDSLQHIGKRAFEHCTLLNSIYIPEGITEIPDRAFYRCSSLQEVILPSTIEYIGFEAFAFCSKLKKINLPNGVKIEQRAFAWCNELESDFLSKIESNEI